MRILMVISSFPPAYQYGGALQVAYNLSRGLARTGHDVTVYTTDVGPNNRRLPISGARTHEAGFCVYRFRNVSEGLAQKENLALAPGIAFALATTIERYDVVHLHEYRSAQAVLTHAIASRHGIPYLVQPHGGLAIVLGRARLKNMYDIMWGRRILRSASRIVAVSSQEAENFRTFGIAPSRIALVPNGVPAVDSGSSPARGHFRTRHGVDADSFVVLFLGRIRLSKGVSTLLDAFETLSKKHPKAVLALCGPDEGIGHSIKFESAKSGLTVIMPGLLTGKEKTEALLDSDVFCLPSVTEALSMALLEAASYGLPIVASSVSAPSEFVAANAGLFVELTPEAIAQALCTLAESPDLRAEFGAKAKSVAQAHFSLQSSVENALALYQRIVGEMA
jgi:glycosyltransferase involved in cell wall biosynthesis